MEEAEESKQQLDEAHDRSEAARACELLPEDEQLESCLTAQRICAPNGEVIAEFEDTQHTWNAHQSMLPHHLLTCCQKKREENTIES